MKIRSGTILFVALFCATAIFVACGHDHDSLYSSLADADKDGEITRGWIPGILPKTSRNIHEAHDLSPEDEWCAFEFDPADSETLKRNLKPADHSVRSIPNPHVPWWPRILMGDLKIDEIRRSGLQLYLFRRPANAVDTATYVFAVDWNEGRGFFFTR